jgi:hypothetical protein
MAAVLLQLSLPALLAVWQREHFSGRMLPAANVGLALSSAAGPRGRSRDCKSEVGPSLTHDAVRLSLNSCSRRAVAAAASSGIVASV